MGVIGLRIMTVAITAVAIGECDNLPWRPPDDGDVMAKIIFHSSLADSTLIRKLDLFCWCFWKATTFGSDHTTVITNVRNKRKKQVTTRDQGNWGIVCTGLEERTVVNRCYVFRLVVIVLFLFSFAIRIFSTFRSSESHYYAEIKSFSSSEWPFEKTFPSLEKIRYNRVIFFYSYWERVVTY